VREQGRKLENRQTANTFANVRVSVCFANSPYRASFSEINMANKINSLSYSIKGKIWLATTALAFFVGIFGTISYLIVSYLVNDSFYAVAVPSLLLMITVAFFGWWISNEVSSPIERVLLLSKSLERGVTSSLPKSSGASETDQLLESLHRISQQGPKLLKAMDEVAAGNFNISLAPLSNSDRVTATFQKLLAKVSESIQAKHDLEILQTAIRRLASEIEPLKQYNLNVSASPENPDTEELSLTFNNVVEQLSDIVNKVKTASEKTFFTSIEIQQNLNVIIEQDEAQIHKLNQASLVFKQIPQMVQQISEELSQSVFSANQSIEKARNGTNIAEANLNAVAQLRRQINESIKRMQRLNECSQEVGKVAKTVEDLAQRTSMVALNASIQAAEMNEQGRSFAVVSEEVERLAERANATNKNISALNKTIQAEIGKVESSLDATVSEASTLSKFAIETGNSIGELERYIGQFLHLQEKIAAYTLSHTEDTETAFATFMKSISETEFSLKTLKESTKRVERIKEKMSDLQDSVSHYDLASETEATAPAENQFHPLNQSFESLEQNYTA
jgi:methyl-accepting chemotaxis protein